MRIEVTQWLVALWLWALLGVQATGGRGVGVGRWAVLPPPRGLCAHSPSQPLRKGRHLQPWKQIQRAFDFWRRAARIYLSYKAFQLRDRLFPEPCRLVPNNLLGDDESVQIDCQDMVQSGWNRLHEVNSDRMMDLCLSLRGFYLKAGQFLGTRHDFMPSQYTAKLSSLQEDVPGMNEAAVRKVVEAELGGPVERFFTTLNLTAPLGSASVAQVHAGVWRATGEAVAVKVQHPGAQRLMRADLRNLLGLARLLQRREIKFDLLSAVREMQAQLGQEFDFRLEATNLQQMGALLSAAPAAAIGIPAARFSSRRLLVMTLLPGESLTKLAGRQMALSLSARQGAGRALLTQLAQSWGEQIFCLRRFHADCHPGNILLDPPRHGRASGGRAKVSVVDWGLVKELSAEQCARLAVAVLALCSRDQARIVCAARDLGVCVSQPDDAASVEAILLTMLDTVTTQQLVASPFHPAAAIKRNRVTFLPAELFFVVRTVQLLRGVAHAFGLRDFSVVDQWAPFARRALATAANEEKELVDERW